MWGCLPQSATAKAKELMTAFGTEDVDAVIGVLLDKGEIQLSAEERDQKLDG